MGFMSDIAGKIRTSLSKDKEAQARKFSKAISVPDAFPNGMDLVQAYGHDAIAEYLRLDQDLLGRYADYEEMDDYPEISTAIDIVADDATQPDTSLNRTVWVTSKSKAIQTDLDDLFHKRLRMDEEAWEIARTLVKYGNDYEELLVSKEGLVGLTFMNAPTVRRVEGPRGEMMGFIYDPRGKFTQTQAEFQQNLALRAAGKDIPSDGVVGLEDWECVHFRMRGKQRRSVYGHSVLEPARWIWKRLNMLEDSAMIYRLQRAPERLAFYIDVGDLAAPEALGLVNRMRQQFRKKKFVNPQTGRLEFKFDPQASDEDFWIPSRNGTDSTRIETISSPQWQHMDDVEYFLNKLFAAIKVPKAYLGQEEGAVRAVLSSMDVRFARTVLRVQRELKNGFRKMARVHLAARGVDPSSVDYEINMTVPSAIFELAQIEVRNARAQLAGQMKDFVSLHYVLSKVFGLSEQDIKTIMKERAEDSEREATNQANANQIMMPQQPGMDGGDQGGVGSGNFGAGGSPSLPTAVPTGGRFPIDFKNARTDIEKKALSTKQLQKHITEEELFRGQSKEAEKRADDKLEKILKNDRQLAARLEGISEMLHDLTGK